jgi:hypothetical protein
MTDATTRRRLVLGARTLLVMLLVAAIALLGLGVAALLLVDPPELNGWLRHLFGRAFGAIAIGMGGILGVPGAIGLWAMAGSTADGAQPAMSRAVRRAAAGLAAVAVVAVLGLGIVTGSGLTILDLGLVGIVALATLGLAGAVSFSVHRGRATLSAVALAAIAGGTLLLVVRLLQVVRP